MARFCEKCGAKLPEDALFCEACGAKISPASDTADSRTDQNQDVPAADGQTRPVYVQENSAGAGSTQADYDQNGRAPAGYRPIGNAARQTEPRVPQASRKAGGGIPKAAIFGAAAIIIIIIAAVTVIGGSKKKAEELTGLGGIQSVSVSTGSGSSGGSSSGGVQTVQGGSAQGAQTGGAGATGGSADLLGTALDALSGGVSADDINKISIPAGAVIKEDAEPYDLVGEYEGEMQLTVIDGFEKIDGMPDSYADERKKALQGLVSCELEINDEGQWEIEYGFMNGMGFRSKSLDDPEDYDMSEEEALLQIASMMINRTSGGLYHAKVNYKGDVEGADGYLHIENIGAYCTDGADSTDRMIAGNFLMQGIMYGADVTVQGDFVVHKTTEDFVPVEAAPAETERDPNAPPVFDENDPASMAYYGIGSGTDTADSGEAENADSENPGVQSGNAGAGTGAGSISGGTESGSSVVGSAREIPTVTGGQWTQMGSGAWVYEKNGKIVKDSWVESKDVYYYVDEDGYMLTSAYTPDGYYVGPDGGYDPYAPQNRARTEGSPAADSSDYNLPDGMDHYDPATYAETGGKWDALPDGSYQYINSKGYYLSNQWVEDRGKYYFIGPDGTMIRNNYASDGFWTGSDGAWDSSVPQRNSDPEPKSGTYEGNVSTWKIKLTKDGTYGKATFSYTSFGGNDVYTLTPLGHGCYLAQGDDQPDFRALMSVSEDGKELIVSQGGITEKCKLK